MRFSEADRILHLYTRERGRIGAIAKGIRKTKSRFGARLEPLSHVELMLHEGSGELQTVTGVDLIALAPRDARGPLPAGRGLIGAEAMLRLFGEPEANARAFEALARFLDLLDETPSGGRPPASSIRSRSRSSSSSSGSSGYLPHVTAASSAARATSSSASPPRAGGAVCASHAAGSLALSPEGLAGIERLLSTPLADAAAAGLGERARREALAVVTSSYEEHGGFRLRTPLGVRRELGDGYELDDDRERIDVAAVHRYSREESYWAPGRDSRPRSGSSAPPPASSASTTRAARSASAARWRRRPARCLPRRRLRARRAPRPRPRRRARARRWSSAARTLDRAWLLHTEDAHELYRRFGFGAPGGRVMERPAAPSG